VSTTTPPGAPPPAWLDADEATTYLRLPSRKSLYSAVARGTVPAHRLGRRVRFRRAELDLSFRGGQLPR